MANGQEVKLLGSLSSPFVQRIKWALNLKSIEYEYLEQDVFNKGTLLLQCNPVYKKVPVLIHNDRPIAESLVILEYLDETWKNHPLLPQDPYLRARARFWAKFVDDKFIEAMRQVLFVDGENQEKEVKNAKDALETLEGELKGNKFFGGESVGFVDVVLGFITLWFEVIEEVACVKVFDSQKFPSLAKWMEDFLEVPEIKENLAKREDLVPYFHKIRQFKLVTAAKK